jgi:hypothetical protein
VDVAEFDGEKVSYVADVVGGGGVWESNPPTGGLTRSTGFEVQGPHQQPNASRPDILETDARRVKPNLADCARKCARQRPLHFAYALPRHNGQADPGLCLGRGAGGLTHVPVTAPGPVAPVRL